MTSANHGSVGSAAPPAATAGAFPSSSSAEPAGPDSGHAENQGPPVSLSRLAGWYAGSRTAAVAMVTVIVWVVFDAFSPTFLSAQNMAGLIDQIVPVAVLSVGMAVVLLSGEIDLSSAAVGGVAATLVARLSTGGGVPLGMALLIGLACACAITLVEALIITRIGVPSFITTLGGMIALGGALLLVLPSTFAVNLAGTSLGNINTTQVPALAGYVIAGASALAAGSAVIVQRRRSTGDHRSRPLALYSRLAAIVLLCAVGVITSYVLGRQGGIPVPVLVMAVVVVAGELALRKTAFGVHLLAVGGSRASARRAGLSPPRVVCGAFAVLGVMAFLSGIFSASLDLGVSAASGPSSEVLDAIASVVVGGTSLFGGVGSITSALVGAALIGSITNGLLLLGVSVAMQSIVTGLILVAAISVDMLLARHAADRNGG